MNTECQGCRFFENEHCKKWRKNGKCDISSRKWFDEEFEFTVANRMCESSSIFGNYYIGVSQEDIDRLKSGEVIHIGGEYGIYIGYKGEKPKGDFHSVPHYRCPKCNSAVRLYRNDPKSEKCGYCKQLLDWSDTE